MDHYAKSFNKQLCLKIDDEENFHITSVQSPEGFT